MWQQQRHFLVILIQILIFCHGIFGNEERPYISEGEWITYVNEMIAKPGPCNLEVVDGTMSNKFFLQKFAYNEPFVVRDATNNDLFRALTRRSRILADWGHTTVQLSSANSYSYDKKMVSFQHYCDKMMDPQRTTTLANETFYFFGGNDVVEWKDLFDEYVLPPYNLPLHDHALSFGLAGSGSGVPFHFHGPGFAETMYGRKRWFLTHPDVKPEFHPNKTTLQWYMEDYPRIKDQIDILECTLRPGELIYFPDRWWHATLNIDTSVFMSVFLSPLR